MNIQKEWDLSPLEENKSFDEITKELEQHAHEFIHKWCDRTDYLTEPTILAEALNEYNTWLTTWGNDGNLGYKLWLETSRDQNNTELKAQFNKMIEFSTQLHNKLQFFILNIRTVDPSNQQMFLEHEGLLPYKHFLEKQFELQKYTLSDKEEQIINLKSNPAYYQWVTMVSTFLSQQEAEVLVDKNTKETKTFEEILNSLGHIDKAIRDDAAKEFNRILEKHTHIAEAEINAVLTNKKIDDQLHGLPRPDTSRHIADDVTADIVDTLIESVQKRNNISHDYYALKAKLFGVEKLQYHERNVPFATKEISYEYKDAVTIVNTVLSNIDPEFGSIFKQFVEGGHIDVFPKKGKRGGAFCAHDRIVHPTYILLNYTNKLRDVCTLAHEVGHGINNELIKKKQNAINFGTPTFTAEVASTFLEDFVFEYLLSDVDEKTRLSLYVDKIGDQISTIHRQVAFYTFEKELHEQFREKGYLSHTEIGELFTKHCSAYMGPAIEQSPGSPNWWIYVNHFRSFFYTYTYASGLLISKALQQKVRNDNTYIEKVKEFLATGKALSPYDIFAKMDIDITKPDIWNSGLDEIEALLNETKELADKVAK